MNLRSRFEVAPGRATPHHLRNGIIAAVVTALLLTSAYQGRPIFLPRGGDIVQADFARAQQVRVNTVVRVAGVTVGSVSKIERPSSGRGALISMRIDDPDKVDLRSDARAHIYERTLLGRNMYIELEPGSRSRPALEKQVIPRSRTTGQVDIDEVLQPLDGERRAGIKQTLDGLRTGLSGERATNRSLRALAPTMRSLTTGLPPLRGFRPGDDLPRLIVKTSRAMGALSRDQAALAGLLENADTTLGVTAARRADLASFLQQTPGTLADTRETLRRLRGTLEVLDPVAEELRPGARRLARTAALTSTALGDATPLLREARPLLTDLNRALRRLRRVGKRGSTLIDGLNPTLDRVRDTFVPWLDKKDTYTGFKNVNVIGPVLGGAASATSPMDRFGHSIVFEPSGGGERTIEDLPCQLNVTDPNPASLVKCEGVTAVLNTVFGGAKPATTNQLRDRARQSLAKLKSSSRIRALRKKTQGSR